MHLLLLDALDNKFCRQWIKIVDADQIYSPLLAYPFLSRIMLFLYFQLFFSAPMFHSLKMLNSLILKGNITIGDIDIKLKPFQPGRPIMSLDIVKFKDLANNFIKNRFTYPSVSYFSKSKLSTYRIFYCMFNFPT